MTELEHLLAVQCELGEGPRWHPIENSLYWTDILGNTIHTLRTSDLKHTVYPLGVPVGCFAFRSTGGLVLAAHDGFATWDIHTQRLEYLSRFPEIQGENRFNDGNVDNHGRFWAGVKHATGNGNLYRLGTDQQAEIVERGISIANGPVWSPDYRTMYFTDTAKKVIRAYDFDPVSGFTGPWKDFARFTRENEYPDGMAVDEQGGIWVAVWGGSRLVRLAPEGNQTHEIQLPVTQPSCCVFGGPDLDVLFITTAKEGLDTDQHRREPLSGDLFRFRPDVRGLPVNFYLG